MGKSGGPTLNAGDDDEEDEDDGEDEDDRNTFDGQIALGSLAGSRSVTRNLSIKNVGC